MTLRLGNVDLTTMATSALVETGVLADADLGNPQVVTEAIRSLFVDGSVVTGRGFDNRTIRLPLLLVGEHLETAAQADAIVAEVDRPSNVLTWKPHGGLEMCFDTFRGSAEVLWSEYRDGAQWRRLDVVLPALPFPRSPERRSIRLGPSTVLLDSVSFPPYKVYDGSAWVAGAVSSATFYAREFLAGGRHSWSADVGPVALTPAKDLTATDSIQATFANKYMSFEGSVFSGLKLTLTSAGGKTATVVGTLNSKGDRVSWSLGDFGAVDLAAVTSWRIQWEFSSVGKWQRQLPLKTRTVYEDVTPEISLSDLRAWPAAMPAAEFAHGSVFRLSGLEGSARSPLALKASRVGGMRDLIVHLPPAPTQEPIVMVLDGAATATTSEKLNLDGTYTVLCILKAANANATLTCTVEQMSAGTSAGSVALSGKVLSANSYIVNCGQITLPLRVADPSNGGQRLKVTISGASPAGTTVAYVLLLDTRGPTTVIDALTAASSPLIWQDAPDPSTGVPGVWVGSVVGDPWSRNLLDPDTASLDGNTDGQWTGSNATLSRELVPYQGLRSLRVRTPGASFSVYTPMPVTPGKTYTWSFYVKADAIRAGVPSRIRLYTHPTGTLMSGSEMQFTPTVNWQRIVYTITLPATLPGGATSLRLQIENATGSAPTVQSDLWIDAVQFELGGIATDFGITGDMVAALGSGLYLSGGAMVIDPAADNQILLMSSSGPPTIDAEYIPRWLVERLR